MADLGDIVRGEGARYLQSRFATAVQQKALADIARCRTAAMGVVPVKCDQCGDDYCLFRSCRNRCCPQCQGKARSNWLAQRKEEILPVDYTHVVFKPPEELNVLAFYHPAEFYDAVIRAAGHALIDVGRSVFRAWLGCNVHLQTWTQAMAFDPHAHCVVPCGGFSDDGRQWISFSPEDLPAAALASRFHTLLCREIRAAARAGKLNRLPEAVSVDGLLASVANRERKVYVKPPFGGPEKLLEYLSRYVYRVAITNDRIESYEDHRVTFQLRDYRHRDVVSRRTVDGVEFLNLFLRHVPPKGFVRIRSFGFMSNRNRKKNLERARELIGQTCAPRVREQIQSVQLCPACSAARWERRPPAFVLPPDVTSQYVLPVRPPPSHPVAA